MPNAEPNSSPIEAQPDTAPGSAATEPDKLDTPDAEPWKLDAERARELRGQVVRAIELLGNEAIADLRESNSSALERDDFAEQLTKECTAYVLRLLVLKFAESR